MSNFTINQINVIIKMKYFSTDIILAKILKSDNTTGKKGNSHIMQMRLEIGLTILECNLLTPYRTKDAPTRQVRHVTSR